VRCDKRHFPKLAAVVVVVFLAASLLLWANDNPRDRVPSLVEWNYEMIAAASSGDAFRGLLLAKRCAESLSERDVADVTAYYAKLPVYEDPQDNRSFPQARPDPNHASVASRLVSFGDGERGIPPCQACHGPVAYRPGVPSLITQNSNYMLDQLEAFAKGARSNDINMPMRTVAGLLTTDERKALAEYYGAGLGLQPGSSK
jgi:cytochrome c553